MQGMNSVNPDVIAMILEQLQSLRGADHEALEMEQDEVLRSLMAQFGLLGVPTPEAGISEGSDELAVAQPPAAAPLPEEAAMMEMLMGGGGGMPMGGAVDGGGIPAGPSDEDMLAMLMGGAA